MTSRARRPELPATTTTEQPELLTELPATTTTELGELLTVPEVAAQLRLDPSTVRRWINDRRLPAVQPGRGYRVERRHVVELLASSRTTTPLTVRP